MHDPLRQLLEKAQPGARISVRQHIARCQKIAQAIQDRFGVTNPHAYQAKHLRWIMAVWLPQQPLAQKTQDDYWRSVRVLIAALHKENHWLPHLQGPWCKINTGRPLKKVHSTPTKIP